MSPRAVAGPRAASVRVRRAAALLLLAACASTDSAPHPAQVLLDADRAFARDALERGLSPAFLALLGEGAVVFRPGPVHAQAWFAEHPEQPELVEWWPDSAEIAGSGDLGWTSGAWELREPAANEQPGEVRARGRYVTVWRLEDGERWAVVLDHGAELQPDADTARAVSLRALAPAAAADPHGATQTFAASDMALARAIDTGGRALRELLDPQVELLRDGHAPAASGLAAEAWGAWRPLHGSTAAGVIVSGDGRLAASWGTLQGTAGRAAWLRIWRIELQGALPTLALDLLTPLPAR